MTTLDVVLSLGLWWAAAAGVWLTWLNRVAAHLRDGETKRVAILGTLAVAAGGSTACAWFWSSSIALAVPATILGLLGLGELRLAVIRQRCRGTRPIAVTPSPPGLLEPVTTTRLVVRHYMIEIPTLPVPRLRVAQLSDLHVGPKLERRFYHAAFEQAASYDPDVLLLTGDLVSRHEDLPLLDAVLRAGPRPSAAYAILGNHDHWVSATAVRSTVAEAGFELVAGRCAELGLRGAGPVYVCGSEHPWGPRPSVIPGDGITIVLSHTPDNVYELDRQGVNVVFSGHVHAGHFRLPGVGALVMPSRYGRRFDRGHFRVGSTHLFVSSGIGGAPLRLWCPPDVLIVDLVRDEARRG